MAPMRRHAAAALGAAATVAFAAAAGPRPAAADGPSAAPARVVSMNLCADELLLRLADPDQVASVTYLSQDPDQSTVAAEARLHPVNHGRAEEVLRLDPDLILAGRSTTRAAVDLLRRVGAPVVELDVPATLPEVESQIRALGAILGNPARADAMIAEIEAAFAGREGPPAGDAPTAVVFAPNGFTVGEGSLVHAIIEAAGLRNLGAEQDLGAYRHLPLERLMALAPDVLIVNADETSPARAFEVLHHPALRKLPGRPVIVRLSPKLWTCAGPEIVRALSILTDAAGRAGGRRS